MTGSLPIGVVVPTYNSMTLLAAHLDSMPPWLDQVEEVVVVDSHSNDGTFEMLQGRLRHPNIRFFSRPRGLYQSWNYGIQQVRSTYTYISTVGDTITPAGLMHLVSTAEKLSCDVVISPPQFVDEAGQALCWNNWPVHDIIALLRLKEDVCIEGILPFFLALSYFPAGALLGSSASNLYRTAVLQGNPFPTEFGMGGDTAWGLFNSLKIRLGITPVSFSHFRIHQRSYALSEYSTHNAERRMLEGSLRTFEQVSSERPDLEVEAAQLNLGRLIRAQILVQRYRSQLISHRAQSWPWVIN
jgi:hypothetical protein